MSGKVFGCLAHPGVPPSGMPRQVRIEFPGAIQLLKQWLATAGLRKWDLETFRKGDWRKRAIANDHPSQRLRRRKKSARAAQEIQLLNKRQKSGWLKNDLAA